MGKKNWTIEEDKAVVRSWLTISEDASTGNYQKADTYWTRITSGLVDVVPKCGEIGGQYERTWKACKTRIGEIKKQMMKFTALMAIVKRMKISGTNSEDEMVKALSMYKKENNSAFANCSRFRRSSKTSSSSNCSTK